MLYSGALFANQTQNAHVKSEMLNTHCIIYWDGPYCIINTSIRRSCSKKKEEERLLCAAAVLRGPTSTLM